MPQPGDSEVQLTITPLKPTELPDEQAVIEAAQRLIQSTTSWKPGRKYSNGVQTYRGARRPEDGAPWNCRVSKHSADEASFDVMWEKLGTVQEAYEKEWALVPSVLNICISKCTGNTLRYIHDIQKVTKVKDLSPTAAIWSMLYSLTPPVSNRVFTVLKVTHFQETSPRTGLVVSIPVDLTAPGSEDLLRFEELGVKGRYVSVERLMELEGGETEWRMATSGTSGGNIPGFISEFVMPSKIAQDVPLFFKWLHAK